LTAAATLLHATVHLRLHLCGYGALRALHSFPTRRSSDLGLVRGRTVHRPAAPRGRGTGEVVARAVAPGEAEVDVVALLGERPAQDRKSTRLNSSHVKISYAVFCLKKKKKLSNTLRHRRRR